MSGVALAIGGAAVLGAGATIYASDKASSATKNASNAAISEQNAALAQQKALAAPYTAEGQAALPTYNNLLGIGPGGPSNILPTLQNLPGYQATYDQGIEAAKRANPNLSGNQVVGAEQFGAQLADSTYSQRLQELLQPIQIGQAAAAGTAANIGANANNVGQIGINQGNNAANITTNEIAGLSKLATGGANSYATYQTLQGLNNPTYPGSNAPLGSPGNMAPYQPEVSNFDPNTGLPANLGSIQTPTYLGNYPGGAATVDIGAPVAAGG
jgi:hypothetical protein